MPKTLRYIALTLAMAVSFTAQAQAQSTDLTGVPGLEAYNALDEKDRRRLDFYASKIVVEIQATVEANQNGDAAGFNKHGAAMKMSAERYLDAIGKAGLDESVGDQLLHQHLSAEYEGPLPPFMVTDNGLAGVNDLVLIMVAPQEQSEENYVDSLRAAGGELLNQ